MSTLPGFWARRRLRAQALDFLKAFRKQRLYNADLISAEGRAEAAAFEEELSAALRRPETLRDGSLSALLDRGDALAGDLFPVRKGDAWRENVEVIFVAIVAALALRAYFLQPFKIPTDSMKPTLYGINPAATEEPMPSAPVRLFDRIVFGRTFGLVVFDHPVRVVGMQGGTFTPWFEYTDLAFDTGETARVWVNPEALRYKLGLRVGQSFAAGEPVARFVCETGDQVLVDKLTYNFRLPKRGEVFVFRTNNIAVIEEDLRRRGVFTSEFYIKRCVGVPGDVLRIDPPRLEINGRTDTVNAAMKRVEAGTADAPHDGYRGYGILPGQSYLRNSAETYEVGPDSFWAMGDNSFNSLDSRFWGTVPRANLVGTGLVVYWPLSPRWGLIR